MLALILGLLGRILQVYGLCIFNTSEGTCPSSFASFYKECDETTRLTTNNCGGSINTAV